MVRIQEHFLSFILYEQKCDKNLCECKRGQLSLHLHAFENERHTKLHKNGTKF